MTVRPETQLRRTWRLLRRDPAAVVAFAWILAMVLVAVLHGLIERYDPNETAVGPPFAGMSSGHWFGTDDLGRDMFSRMVAGTSIAMQSSLIVVAAALAIAVPLGLVAGYLGGVVDNVLMRVMDAILSFPALVLAIGLVGALGPSLRNAMIAITVALVPGLARLTRGQALAVKEETFVEASQSIGVPGRRVVLRHVLPNVLSPIVVQASIALGVVLLAEAGLSFLGLGKPPPAASWGSMLRRSYDNVLVHPWHVIPPGVAITVTVLAYNTLGEGLRSALGGQPVRRGHGRLGLTTVDRPSRPSIGAPSSERPAEAPALLSVRGLSVQFDTARGPVTVVDGVSFTIAPGETMGLVGESGSGKTVTSLAIMRLLPSPPARIAGGAVLFDGVDLLGLSFAEMSRRRGSDISMVFQDPMASMNPTLTVRHQVAQVVRWHEGATRRDADRRALEALDMVGIARSRVDAYTHELSGGMRQRAMISMAIVCRPKLLIADEPTTALDVTIQAQVLELLQQLSRETSMATLFVTHDLGVVAEMCDRVTVMYAGQVVESAPVRELFHRPLHPYTSGLLRAMPQRTPRRTPLYSIPGTVPQFHELGTGCRLLARCPDAASECQAGSIEIRAVGSGRLVRCVRAVPVDVGEGACREPA